MRCPKCGKWNKSSLPRCFGCGTPLVANTSSAHASEPFRAPAQTYEDVSPKEVVANVPEVTVYSKQELLERKERGSQFLRLLKKDRGDLGQQEKLTPEQLLRLPPIDADVPQITKPIGRRNRREASSMSRALAKVRPLDQIGQRMRGIKHRRNAHTRGLRVFLRIACVLFLIFALGYGGMRVYNLILDQIQNVNAIPNDDVVSMQEEFVEDGVAYHAVTIFGEDGETVFIKELKQSYVILGGQVRIVLADDQWIPKTSLGTEEEVEVQLTPYISSKNGEQRFLFPVKFGVKVPASTLNLIRPAKERVQVTTSMYAIRLQVSPGSKVIFAGRDVSDLVDKEGQLLQNVDVEPIGDNVFPVTVTAPGCRASRTDIILNRPEQDIALEIAQDTTENSTKSNVQINGQVQPGATLVVESPIQGSLSIDENGTFSFTANLTRIGENTIFLRAKMEGKKDSVISHQIHYLPGVAEYTRKAWALDYKTFLTNYITWQGRIFECKGTIQEQLSNDPIIYLMNVSKGETAQLITLELSTGESLNVGASYRIYADVNGEYEQYPKLMARYIYSQ